MSETTNRVLSLLNLLQTHRHWPGTELARRLGITGRTLRRDIDRLRELGYQVEATRGAAGGYRLEAGSQLPPLLLTDEEAVTMAIGLRLAATQGLVDGAQTTLSALAKFEQILPSALRRRVNALAHFVSTQTPGSATISPELLGRLALVCRDRERIRFSYTSGDGSATARVVEPNTVVASLRTWYLLGWDLDRAAWRTFRVDRISALFGTSLRFAHRELPGGDGAAYVANSFRALRHRHTAQVILAMPLEQMQEAFGAYAVDAVRVDDQHSRWPIAGESLEMMMMALMWIPPDVQYTVEAEPGFLQFLGSVGRQLIQAAE